MGWSFRSAKSLPDRYSIIGCAWPLDEVPGAPADVVRPCLVVETRVQYDEGLKIEYGVIRVSYGTKQGIDSKRDMIVGQDEYRKIGLDYPTRFSMDLNLAPVSTGHSA